MRYIHAMKYYSTIERQIKEWNMLQHGCNLKPGNSVFKFIRNCQTVVFGLFSGSESIQIRLWWWLRNSMNILNSTDLYTLNGWIIS